MDLAWRICKESHNGTPISHWWQTLFVGEDDPDNDRIRFLQMLSATEDAPGRNARALNVLGRARISRISRVAGGADPFETELKEIYGDALRVPIAEMDMLTDPGGSPSFDVDDTKMEVPPEGTVMVGVIDDAIGFANRRFRLAEDKSRFFYHWQQGQSVPVKGKAAVPFGKEYLQQDLDAALATRKQERAIYRDLGLVGGDRRTLLKYASHGNSVMDAAAGAPIGADLDGKPAEEVRLFGVNLPIDVIADGTGTYLEFFAVLGLMRIMDHIEALEKKASDAAGKTISYPVVINFSFGLTSGAPNTNSLLARQVDAIADGRKAAGKAPMHFIVPAGNQREARTLGKIKGLKAGSEEAFLLRVPIHSATSTVFEISCDSGFDDLQADLIAPFHAASPQAGIDLSPGQFCVLSDPGDPDPVMAAVYRTKGKLICMIAPTRPREDAHFVVAQPGHWQVRLRAKGDVTGILVQIARGDAPGAQFYRGYQSRLVERSFANPSDPATLSPFIQEEGTLNTLAGARNATIVKAQRGLRAGRGSKLAKYSGLPDPARPVPGTFTQEIAEELPSLDGRRTTGMRSGSIVRLGGTSIAAGLAARRVALGQPLNPADVPTLTDPVG
jgi:hypothetical protein